MANSVTFEVSSTTAWQDTKVDVEAGTTIEYVSGKWQVWPPKGYCDGDGMASISTGMSGYLLPTAKVGALIGKIGEGAPFLVGNKVVVNQPGRLFLSANDEAAPKTGGKGFSDNDGSLTVKITMPKRSFEVSSTIAWQDTKVDVKPGMTVAYVSGKWQVWPPKGYCDGNGMDISTGMSGYLLPTAKVGALIGKIGQGAPFLVGNKVVVNQPGRLFLSANDEANPKTGGKGFSDNDGSLVVEIF